MNAPDTPHPRNPGNSAVVIAIVGYRNAGDVHTCLSALAALTEKNILISICENGGAVAFSALIARLSELVEFGAEPLPARDQRVVKSRGGQLRQGGAPVRIYQANDNLGYAGGINVSLAQLGPDQPWSAMWILNPDTQPHPDALTALIARARAGFGIVGSRMIFKNTGRVQCYGGGRWRWIIARGRNLGWNAAADATPDVETIEREMNYVSGASLYATRDHIERTGPLDERYFLYCEEVDWCFRGNSRLGYAHDSIVHHAHGTTIGSTSTRKTWSDLTVYLDERNKLLITRRFFPGRYFLVLLASLVLTLQYLRLGAPKNFLVAIKGWWAGLRGEEGLPKRFAPREATP